VFLARTSNVCQPTGLGNLHLYCLAKERICSISKAKLTGFSKCAAKPAFNTSLLSFRYGQPEDEARAKAGGFDHHLVKPVSPEQLVALLGQLTAL
jgi:hypothetical protein